MLFYCGDPWTEVLGFGFSLFNRFLKENYVQLCNLLNSGWAISLKGASKNPLHVLTYFYFEVYGRKVLVSVTVRCLLCLQDGEDAAKKEKRSAPQSATGSIETRPPLCTF